MVTILDPTLMPYAAAFLFVFAILFGLLSHAKIFNRNINAILALVFGLFTVIYEPFVLTMQTWLPVAAIVFVILFFILFIKKTVAGGKEKSDPLPAMISIGILLLLLGVFWSRLSAYVPAGVEASNMLWIIGVVIVIAIFGLAYSTKSGPQ